MRSHNRATPRSVNAGPTSKPGSRSSAALRDPRTAPALRLKASHRATSGWRRQTSETADLADTSAAGVVDFDPVPHRDRAEPPPARNVRTLLELYGVTGAYDAGHPYAGISSVVRARPGSRRSGQQLTSSALEDL